MNNNTLEAIKCICIAFVLISFIIGAAWIMLPTEFTFDINLTADDNIVEIVETADEIHERESNMTNDKEYWYNEGKGRMYINSEESE